MVCNQLLPMAAKWSQLIELLLCCGVGVAVFIAIASLLKMEEAKMVMDILARRFHRKKPLKPTDV